MKNKSVLTKIDSINQKKIFALIKHRGPSNYGHFLSKNYAVSCSRLSIVDQRKVSNLPFETNNYVMGYNGQIYNYEDLKKKLIERKKVIFNTNSDTEVFIKGYEVYGNKFFSMCQGMFAAAIYDKLKKKLIFVVDPLSIKNLFYYFDKKNSKIYFSSESKSLNKVFRLGVNYSLIKEWFLNNQIRKDLSLFNKIERVPGGTIIEFDKNLKKKKYKFFDLKYTFKKKKIILKKNDLSEIVDLEKYISLEEKKNAILLSGGIDSTLLAKKITENKKKNNFNLIAYNANIKFKNLSEINKVISFIKTIKLNKLKFLHITKRSFLKNFFYISKNSSLPLFNPNLIVFFNIVKKIKKDKIKVAFTGDGADEFFNGYNWSSKKMSISNLLCSGSGLTEKKYSEFFLNNKIINKQYLIKKKLFKNETRNIPSILKNRFFNQTIYLDKWLRTRDELGMLNGVEVRVPYCDNKIINFTNSLPENSDLLKNKFFLKNQLNYSFNNFKKLGFTIPFFSWMNKKVILNILKKTNFYRLKIFKINHIMMCLNNRKLFFKNKLILWQIISFCVWEKFCCK